MGEEAERAAFFDRAATYAPYVVVVRGGAAFAVATDDPGVGRDVFVAGRRPEFIVLDRALGVLGPPAQDSLFVDVGANIGTSTIPALVNHGFAAAIACEPGASAARALRVARALNGLEDRMQVVEAAVSDVEGVRRLGTEGRGPGVYEIVAPDAAGINVRAVTIDGLVERGVIDPMRVGLFWVDAQGHEGQVLAGARSLLDAHTPVVVALRPKKLRRGGGDQLFLELLEAHYDQVADLRSPGLHEPAWRAELEPIDAIHRYVAENRKTDILTIARR